MNAPNPAQQRAMTTTEGPVLIIAGPGSGKTFTLVERALYLIQVRGVTPEHLLISTFTQKAARELLTRLSNRLLAVGARINPNALYTGTLHAVCLDLLEEHREFTRLKRNYTVLDQFDQQYFFYRRLRDYEALPDLALLTGPLDKTPRWERAERLMTWINKVTEEALDVLQLEQSPDASVQVLAAAWRLYQQQLADENALDFATIQWETLRLLETQPTVRAAVQAQFRYLMIDEYQDTNTIQERLIFLIGARWQNICVVGDDDQGLYRFRGATIRNILEFPHRFAPGQCQQITLSLNYRSEPAIIDFYNRWMTELDWAGPGGVPFRFAKTIQPEPGKVASTLPAVVRVAGQDGQDNWGAEVIAFLQALRGRGLLTDWNQAAFLFHSVASDRAVRLAGELEAAGIPVFAPRSKLYFARPEVRLMIGALVFLFPQFPTVRAERADQNLTVWADYDHCFAEFAKYLQSGADPLLLKWCQQMARRHRALSRNTDYAFSGLFYELLRFPLFAQHFGAAADGGVRDSRPARNLAQFSALLTQFEHLHGVSVFSPDYLVKTLRDFFNRFLRFLIEGGLSEYEDAGEYAPSGCVSFMTIHQAKGLEFPVVLVGSLEAVPRKQYTDLDEVLQNQYYQRPPFEPLERTKFFDFWRLYYTAFSRAQDVLVLTGQENTPKYRGDRALPSKYFRDLYATLPAWRDPAWQAGLFGSGLTLHAIRPASLKREYSFTSHVLLYEGCAQQYRFFKDLEFAPVRKNALLFGTLVHQTIEDVHKAVLRGEEPRVTTAQIDAWFDSNYAHLVKSERTYLAPNVREIAREHVQRYVERERGQWHRLREAEVELTLLQADYILKGQVDLIRGDGDTVEIVDFKAEKKPDLYADRAHLERYRRQLQIYAYLVEQQHGQRVSKMHLYFTSERDGNPYVSFPVNPAAIQHTIAQVDALVERIERKDYRMSARPVKLCDGCDLRHYCDANLVCGGP